MNKKFLVYSIEDIDKKVFNVSKMLIGKLEDTKEANLVSVRPFALEMVLNNFYKEGLRFVTIANGCYIFENIEK